ncbi:MAG: penicillin-binding protein [Microgenomates group bacterium]
MGFLKNWRWRQNSPFKHSRIIFYLGVFSLFLVGFLIFFTLFLFAWYSKDLPSPDKVVRKEGFATKIYDREGNLLYDVFKEQRRIPISWEEIPEHLKNATIAIEDKNFYQHRGFDVKGILRAIRNIIIYRRLQGGSTLTQQLVKNTLLTPQRTLTRKIKEFILAVQIESKYTKDQILLMYLNEAPYGGTAWGVGAAAEIYFGKKVKDLNLVESAILAGLPQRPSFYSPFSGNDNAYIGRTHQVLRRMREDGYITPQQEEEAKKQLEEIKFSSPGVAFKAPHFVMYVKKQLEEKYGQEIVEKGGLRVTTSLDLKIQEEAEKIVKEEIAKVEEKYHITNGAAVVVNPQTGEILAMVGSKDYNDPNYDGKVNVTLSLRQPGSAIKPVTYVTAFKKGYTPATLLMDTPTVFKIPGQPDYKPVNYDGKFHGPMQVRYALGNSINIPAIKMLAIVGIKEMLKTAYEMGITSLEPNEENLKRLGLSVTLGGGEVRLLEITTAYSAFANGGLKVEPVSILKVTDSKGKVLEEIKPGPKKRVLKESEAFLISHILADNSARLITFGSQSALVIPGRTVAVKTGTTNDRRDNWAIGWTPQVVVGVWVGNNDNSPMKGLVSGVSGAAPIWRRIIQYALKGKPNLEFIPPSDIVTTEVDVVSGYRAHDGFPSRTEYFIKGTEPTGEDPVHVKLKLCRGQEKLATPAQIARGDYEEREYFIFKEEDPVSTDGVNRWQEGINQWLATQGDSRYHPPTEYCGDTGEMVVRILKPSNESQINNNEVEVEIEVASINRVTKIQIFVDDNLKEELTSRPYKRILVIADGPHKIKIKAFDEKGNSAESEIKIGVNVPWNWSPSPSPTPTLFFSPTPTINFTSPTPS